MSLSGSPQAYKSDYDIAKARENSLQESLAATVAGSQTTNKAQVELRQLERCGADLTVRSITTFNNATRILYSSNRFP